MSRKLTGSHSGFEVPPGRLLQRLAQHRDRLLRRALRLAPPGLSRVVIDTNCPGWLGLPPGSLFKELVRRRLWPIPLNCGDLERWEASAAGPASPAAVDTTVYQLCITHEILPDELTAGMRESRPLADEYRRSLEAARRREVAFDRLARRLRFRAVAYMQGYTPIAAALRGVAVRRGIGMVGLENTLFSDRVTWDGDAGIACFSNRAPAAFRLRAADHALLPGEPATWDLGGRVRDLKAAEHSSGTQPLAVRGPYVLFLGQVFTDASIVFGCRPGWGPLQVIAHLRRWLSESRMSLVVKGHPKEAGGVDPVLGKAYDGLFARRLRTTFPDMASAGDCIIDADNRLDTYAAIRAAACVVTMNSQAGIEAAALGVPTIVCARANYAACGFTFDGSNPAALRNSIQACLTASPEERLERQRAAVAFVRILRERVFVPRTAAAIAEVIADVAHHDRRGDGES